MFIVKSVLPTVHRVACMPFVPSLTHPARSPAPPPARPPARHAYALALYRRAVAQVYSRLRAGEAGKTPLPRRAHTRLRTGDALRLALAYRQGPRWHKPPCQW